MRWAYVCADPGVPVFGRKGCTVHVQEVVRALVAQGVDVEIFAARTNGTPPDDLADIRCHALPCPTNKDRAIRERECVEGNRFVRQSLKNHGPFDCVYERYSLWSTAGMDYSRSQRNSGLLEVNSPLIDEQARHRGLVNRPLAESMARRIFSAASAIVAVSRDVAKYVQTTAIGEVTTCVIPNGVNMERFANASPARKFSGPTIGFVGTLKPWHGVELLLGAFARVRVAFPAATLVVVGDGPELSALLAEVHARGLTDAVHFTGNVDPSDVPAWLAAMDIAVAPYPSSTENYFSPLKVFEYMAAERAIVASRIGQIPEVIEDGITGLLCRAGDCDELAERIIDLASNADLRHRLATAARHTVSRKYTWQAVAGRLLDLAHCRDDKRTQHCLVSA